MVHEWGYTYLINNISAAFSRRLLKFVSHPGGSYEHFGTHEKLSWGGGVQGNLNWMPGYEVGAVKLV